MTKESQGGQDRRTGLELVVVRDALSSLRGLCRWIPHDKNPTDAMTKVYSKSNVAPLHKLLKTGQLCITDEIHELEKRVEIKKTKGYVPRPKAQLEVGEDAGHWRKSHLYTEVCMIELLEQLLARGNNLYTCCRSKEPPSGGVDFI